MDELGGARVNATVSGDAHHLAPDEESGFRVRPGAAVLPAGQQPGEPAGE